MAHIEIKARQERNYAYYVTQGNNGKKNYKYIGPIAKSDPNGTSCPRCGKKLTGTLIKKTIVEQLKTTLENMRNEKKHLTNYSRFALLEELVRVFSQ